jgi:hypothetical protein
MLMAWSPSGSPIESDRNCRTWGLVGGSRSLGCGFKGDIGTPVFSFSLYFLAGGRRADFLHHACPPWCSVSSQAQKQQSQLTMDWNLWNHEWKYTFHLVNWYAQIFCTAKESYLFIYHLSVFFLYTDSWSFLKKKELNIRDARKEGW